MDKTIYCPAMGKEVNVSYELIGTESLEDRNHSFKPGRIECSEKFCNKETTECPIMDLINE